MSAKADSRRGYHWWGHHRRGGDWGGCHWWNRNWPGHHRRDHHHRGDPDEATLRERTTTLGFAHRIRRCSHKCPTVDGLDPHEIALVGRGHESEGTHQALANAQLSRPGTSGNVFLDIGFSPEEAQNLQLRSELMSRIERFVKRNGMTQTQAARALGVTQPRLNALLKGKIDQFSLDVLVNMLAHGGMRVEMKVKKAA